jgi:hypothetical protein
MAERTLAEVATANRPSMVAGTEEEAYARFIDVRGPYKVETIYFQQAAANDFKAADTFNSQLAHPMFATVAPAQDIDGTALVASVDLTSDESNANFRQITLNDAEGINGLGIIVTVYGF